MRTHGDPREWTEAWQFSEAWPQVDQAIAHAVGSDVQGDVPILYSLAMETKPAVIVELGTRQGTSTRTLAFVAKLLGATFYTVDPDPGCHDFIKDILHPEHCIFLNMTGEHAFTADVTPSPDLLFIDTDPHTYEQTLGWLNTWVRQAMPHKAVAAFHDTVPARPEIQVGRAVEEWIKVNPGYLWRTFPTTYGLGLLWKQ